MCHVQPTYKHRSKDYNSFDLYLLNIRFSNVFDVKLRSSSGDRFVTYDGSGSESDLLDKVSGGTTYGVIVMPYNLELITKLRGKGYANIIVAVVHKKEREHDNALICGYDAVICKTGKAVEKLYPMFRDVLAYSVTDALTFFNKHLLKYQQSSVKLKNHYRKEGTGSSA